MPPSPMTAPTTSRGTSGENSDLTALTALMIFFAAIVIASCRVKPPKQVGGRAERFKLEYEILCEFSTEWAKRNVRQAAAMFRKYGLPQDIALLPDIGEPL